MRLEKTVLLVVALVVGMGGTANAQGSCSTYPLVWAPAANAQADAQTDLTSIANPFLPAPSMNWSTPRGTFTSVGSLDYVFPSCASGTNVSAALFTLAGTVPDLLPIASGEWTVLDDQLCQNVSSSAWQTIHIQRASLAGEDEKQDVFYFTVLKGGTNIMVRSMIGDWIPVATTMIDQNMAACGTISQGTAESSAFAGSFPYSILDTCDFVSQEYYVPGIHAEDTLTVVGNPYWEWTDGTSSVSLRKKRRYNLEINPLNVNQALIDSDAYCGPNVPVGFELVLDAVTGAVLHSKAGLGCVVCV